MRKDRLLLVVLFLLGIAITVVNTHPESGLIVKERSIDQYSDIFFTYTTVKYPAMVEVLRPSDNLTVSFNTGTDILDFSRVASGGSVKKQLNLTTIDGKPSKITIMTKGAIGPLLSFGNNDFILNGNGAIAVTVNTAGQQPGNYTGEVAVYVQRSNYDMQRMFIGY